MLGKIIAILAAALLLAGCGERVEQNTGDGLRIVSIAPNVTEILYAIGRSNEVVGVSRYSKFPPEAQDKPQVGGTYDPNWEIILSLQPDLVIGLDSQEEIAAQLKQLGIRFLGVPHERIDEIMQSILIIGEACGAEAEAQKIFQGLEKRMADVSKPWKNPPPASRTPPWEGIQKTSPSTALNSPPAEGCPQGGVGLNKPRVLVCIGHDEQLSRMYIAAKNTFYDDLITLAGGTNACEQTVIKYPEISPESLRSMNPDIIIDIVPNPGKNSSTLWKPYRAVTLTNSYAFIPGPRFGLLLTDFQKAIQHLNAHESHE